ncbi:MAG: hypothetical protein AAF624_18320 [Bacteroidota bacterium]
MGQQQLLLLVLGIVIVGLAVVTGIQAFQENQRKTRQDTTMAYIAEIASKAQLWKKTPVALGGGDNGDPDDFMGISFEKLGYAGSEVRFTSQSVLRFNEYTCIKLIPSGSRLDINALNTDCEDNTWWMSLRLTGSDYDDITFQFDDTRSQSNSY